MLGGLQSGQQAQTLVLSRAARVLLYQPPSAQEMSAALEDAGPLQLDADDSSASRFKKIAGVLETVLEASKVSRSTSFGGRTCKTASMCALFSRQKLPSSLRCHTSVRPW